MKINRPFKTVLYASLATLYVPGVATWALQNWFKVDRGFGAEPIWQELWALRMHSIAGLWFLMVFGFLVNSHVLPALRNGLRLFTGITLLLTIALLIATVPGLYYLTSDSPRAFVSFVHVYLGLLSLVPFAGHLLRREPRKASPRL